MMIVRQWVQILDETKTATRRLHDTYKVGSVQAVVPKYLRPSVWWKQMPHGLMMVENPRDHMDGLLSKNEPIHVVNTAMIHFGWNQGKVRIVAKRQECLQDITEADAIAEGVLYDAIHKGYYVPIMGDKELYACAVDAYHALWESINSKKGTRWDDNPLIYAYTLGLVKPS